MAIVVGYGTSSILTGIFTCWPVEIWKIGDLKLQAQGHCVNKFPYKPPHFAYDTGTSRTDPTTDYGLRMVF